MAHFDPLKWQIDILEHSVKDLEQSVEAQSKFVHEYIHYVQALTSTIGRNILLEMVRLMIFAGFWKHYRGSLPKKFEEKINLKELLENSSPNDFRGTEPAAQYQEFYAQLGFALADNISKARTHNEPEFKFVRMPLLVGKFCKNDFVHLVVTHDKQKWAVPITDRVVFENMARQVQRNYLGFNCAPNPDGTLNKSLLDGERRKVGDLVYTCLYDTLEDTLPRSEDVARWTIGLCQFALLCRYPGLVLEYMIGRLDGRRVVDVQSFLMEMRRDSFFVGEYNTPPLQETLNEVVGKWGTAILMSESWELREITKHISNAYNALIDEPLFFASPLLSIKEVQGWMRSFGCPPVRCADGALEQLYGVALSKPWHRYFELADSVLL